MVPYLNTFPRLVNQSTEANLKYCELALSRKKQTVHSIFISAEGTAAMKELSKVEKMLKVGEQ
jgi:hypothetical protein